MMNERGGMIALKLFTEQGTLERHDFLFEAPHVMFPFALVEDLDQLHPLFRFQGRCFPLRTVHTLY